MTDLQKLVRPNIWALKPYSCARDEYQGPEARAYLDANECPYNAPWNRYPDPLQRELKARLAELKGVRPEETFLGNGSDEAIDLVYRIFCRPGADNVVAMAPTYGMYEVCAGVNDVEYIPVPLASDYSLSADAILAACTPKTKVVWLCSPNNPTGNQLDSREVDRVLREFGGIVVVDEAYGEFAAGQLYRTRLAEFPNLIVLNTMSKAWASASVRIGIAFASPEIISLMNRVKYPYNISLPNQQTALSLLQRMSEVEDWRKMVLAERSRMERELAALPLVERVCPSDANFVLVITADATAIYNRLVGQKIIVRNRTNVMLCAQGLRITIGTPQANDILLEALKSIKLP